MLPLVFICLTVPEPAGFIIKTDNPDVVLQIGNTTIKPNKLYKTTPIRGDVTVKLKIKLDGREETLTFTLSPGHVTTFEVTIKKRVITALC